MARAVWRLHKGLMDISDHPGSKDMFRKGTRRDRSSSGSRAHRTRLLQIFKELSRNKQPKVNTAAKPSMKLTTSYSDALRGLMKYQYKQLSATKKYHWKIWSHLRWGMNRLSWHLRQPLCTKKLRATHNTTTPKTYRREKRFLRFLPWKKRRLFQGSVADEG